MHTHFFLCLCFFSLLNNVHLPLKRIGELLFEYYQWRNAECNREEECCTLKRDQLTNVVPKRQNRVKIDDVNHFAFIGLIMKDTECASYLSSMRVENSICYELDGRRGGRKR